MNGDLGQLLVSQIREANRDGAETLTWETSDLMYLVGWIEALERTNKIIAYLSGEE